MLQRALEMRPKVAFAHAALASLLSWQTMNGVSGLYAANEAAILDRVRIAQRLSPNDPYVLHSIGSTLCRVRRFKEGLSHLRRANELAPTVRTMDQLAACLCFVGEPAEAVALFREILTTMPTGHVLDEMAGALSRKLGELDEAEQLTAASVLHFPDDYFGWVLHANLLALRECESEARAALGAAIRIVPGLRLEAVVRRIESTYVTPVNSKGWLTAGLRRLFPGDRI